MSVEYALKEPFKIELARLEEYQILAQLGMNETGEWCKSFVTVPRPTGTACLCFDPI